ncbi:IclR family transcriptional regulator [Anaerosporomusa subterranea]|uniref:IclR family transcriptional regulator n=2 Tax=Anaerosporomusa subterranea TaxID=1794912 RepID=A0A154BWT3_ANASB|nr:IclR family transcriptional regulator [Anaerosporomusa subterranea]MDF2502261.1 transcriptional regulator, IclR family [Anaerosporomusa subterranea]
MTDTNKDMLNGSITKAITILNCFSYDKTRLRLKDISQMTGINQATAHRMLNTLKEFNLVEQNESSYSLGRGFLKYEGIVLNSIEIRRIGLPYLEELSNSLRVNVNLAILDEKEVVYVARAETPYSSYAYFHIGMRRPIHCTALGKVLTCKSPEIAREVIRQGVTRLTMNTFTDEVEFLEELEKVRLQGYAVDFEELSNGINCVAVPIRNASGEIVAAISISGPTSKYPREKILEYVPGLMNCANRISARMGARGNW